MNRRHIAHIFLLVAALFAASSQAQLFLILRNQSLPGTGDAPPTGWAAVEIDNATNPLNSTTLSYSGASSTFTVGVNGGRIYGTEDAFGGWYYQVPASGDFTLTARVVTATQTSGISSKSGIMLRESLAKGSAHCMAAIFGLNGTLVDCRATTDGTTSSDYFQGSQVAVPECFKIEGDGDIQSVRIYQKADATDCSTGTYTLIHQFFPAWFANGTVSYVFLATTPTDANNAGKNANTTFDQVTVSTASVVHSPGSVDFTPTIYTVNEDAGSKTFTVTRSGDGTGACTIDYATVNGTAVGGTDFTSVSDTLTWSDAEVGEKTFNVSITDIDGVTQGNKTFTVALSIDSCGDNLGANIATITIQDQDTATGPKFATATPSYDSIWPDTPCLACDWDNDNLPTFVVRHVTTTSGGTGAGSFRNAVTTSWGNACLVVVFDVGPMISFPFDTQIKTPAGSSCLVVSGSSAPGGYIILYGARFMPFTSKSLFVDLHVWQQYHAPLESDGSAGPTSDAVQVTGASGHVEKVVWLGGSVFFAGDENFSTYNDVGVVSLLQTIIGYGTGNHGFSTLFGSGGHDTRGPFDLQRNVMAFSNGRNPRITSHASVINNFVVGYKDRGAETGNALLYQNYVSNLFVLDDDHQSASTFYFSDNTSCGSRIFWEDSSANNLGYNGETSPPFINDKHTPDCKATVFDEPAILTTTPNGLGNPWPTGVVPYTITNTNAGKEEFGQLVTECAGTPQAQPAIAQQLIDDALTFGASGEVIDHPNEVGAPPTLQSQTDSHEDLPADPNAAGTHINAIMDWVVARHDAVKTSGKGCY